MEPLLPPHQRYLTYFFLSKGSPLGYDLLAHVRLTAYPLLQPGRVALRVSSLRLHERVLAANLEKLYWQLSELGISYVAVFDGNLERAMRESPSSRRC